MCMAHLAVPPPPPYDASPPGFPIRRFKRQPDLPEYAPLAWHERHPNWAAMFFSAVCIVLMFLVAHYG